MPLTEAEQRIIIDSLTKRLGGRKLECPISGDSEWQVQDHFGQIPAGSRGGVLTLASYPNAVILCRTCGYTILLNLYRLGIAGEFDIPQEQDSDVPTK